MYILIKKKKKIECTYTCVKICVRGSQSLWIDQGLAGGQNLSRDTRYIQIIIYLFIHY